MVDAYSDAANAATYTIRSVESMRSAALSRSSVYSMSSATRWSSDVGSLKDTGSVIFVMSFPIIDLRMLYTKVSPAHGNLIANVPIAIS